MTDTILVNFQQPKKIRKERSNRSGAVFVGG